MFLIKSSPLFGEYTEKSIETTTAGGVVPYRPLEDFMSFTFRPWYFVLPPTESIFLGDFSTNVYNRLAKTNYFLAQNYDVQEAGGAFLGYSFIFLTATTVILLFQHKLPERRVVLILTTAFVLILMITGPPYLTISGIKIYTPSYLLYQIMPPFRVLVRFSVVLFLINLILAGFSIQHVINYFKNKRYALAYSLSFVTILAVLSLFQFSIPLPIVNISNPPNYIDYLKKPPPLGPIVVYPYNNFESNFWLISRKIPIYNFTYSLSPIEGRRMDEFSKKLNSHEGLEKAKRNGIRRLVLINTAIKEEEFKFFSENLVLEENFDGVSIYKFRR